MELSSLLTSDWSSLVSALPSSLDLTALARSKKAIVRGRQVSDGETLLRLALWYGPCGMSLRTASALATGTGTAVLSDVGLLKRLAGSSDWLEAVVTALLAERQTGERLSDRPLVMVDGTSISRPGSVGAEWVLHSRYDPDIGFNGFELTDRHGGESLKRHHFGPGDIVLADRGYAQARGLLHVQDRNADFVVRTGWRSLAFRDADGNRFDPLDHFKDLPSGQTGEIRTDVAVDGQSLPVRLVVFAKDDNATQAELKRVKRKAMKCQRTAHPRTQLATRYTMIVTSLDAETYPTETVLALYRQRWQIELAFKRLKSLIHIDRLPAKNKDLARTWLYAHLVLAILIDTMTQQMLDSPPCPEDLKGPPPFTVAKRPNDDHGHHDGDL